MQRLRKTKIVATIGPASSDYETIKKLIGAGLNVARINRSHGSYEEHIQVIENLKRARQELNTPTAILLDTKGPEVRIGQFANDGINIEKGDKFTFTTEDIVGDQSKVSISYKGICEDLENGDVILVNDGLLKFVVESIEGTNVNCVCDLGGEMQGGKGVNFPNKILNMEYLSERDKMDLEFACQQDLDFIACSFVSTPQDIKSVREFVDAHGGKDIELIAKIESQGGFDNLTEICDECAGVMVARGDLGVEIDFYKLPLLQKRIIQECRIMGKCVITATEMLETMKYNARPTRAEVSDVANAIYDGTSAIMLSAETAQGKYPVRAVETMSRIAIYAEGNSTFRDRQMAVSMVVENEIADAVAHAACTMAQDVSAVGIVNYTETGYSSKLISNFRSVVDAIAITGSRKVFYQLSLYWGINPMYFTGVDSYEALFHIAKKHGRVALNPDKGDKIVVCTG